MFILIVAIISFCCWSIAKRAQQNNLSPFSWVLGTFVMFCVGTFFGCIVLSFLMMKKNPAFLELAAANDRNGLNELLTQVFAQNQYVFSGIILSGGLGGYLLVRYLLDRRATKGQ